MRLKELRRLFRRSPKESARAIRKAQVDVDEWNDFRYRIRKDGKDALFKFGRHKNRTVSQVLELDPEYLNWILQKDSFPDEIKEIIKYVTGRAFALAQARGEGIKGAHADVKIIDDPIRDWPEKWSKKKLAKRRKDLKLWSRRLRRS